MNAIFDPEKLVAPAGPLRLVVTASLEPVGGVDRFQPAGFPEIGHVIYDAPRGDDKIEKVCIVDSPASMANHLERVCMRSTFDPTPVDVLSDLPYLRCVTDVGWPNPDPSRRELVVTSLTEGHRIASGYFLDGKRVLDDGQISDTNFSTELQKKCDVLPIGKRSHPLPDAWWSTFRTLFHYDPNSLVHGVLFPQWQVKVPRVLTAHHEAMGARRVDRSGVKFDRLEKTSSGQPIFATDDETASEIRGTFIFDLALLRSFGRESVGLNPTARAMLAAFALWKVGNLLSGAFRYRSGCDLVCRSLRAHVDHADPVDVAPADLAAIDIAGFIAAAKADLGPVTDIYRTADDLFRPGKGSAADDSADDAEEEDEEETRR